MTTWGGDKQFQYQVYTPRSPYVLCLLDRGVPLWWSQAGECGTNLLYQAEPGPDIYIVSISSNLGRLPLVPAGDHRTIPAAMRNGKSQLFKYGECDKDGRRGSGSKLYYINQCHCGPCAGPLTIRRGPRQAEPGSSRTSCKPLAN